jgi:hypothetical protein
LRLRQVGIRRLIKINYHDDLKEVQGDAALASLLSAPAAQGPFDRLSWWQGLVEECDFFPVIAVARDGETRAALPMFRVKRRLDSLANWYNFTVRPIVSPGADRPALLKAMAEDLVGEAPHIILSALPDDNDETDALAAAFRSAGWLVFRESCDINHYLPINGRSYAEYMEARPGPLRTTLKRKASKVTVSIETHFSPDSWHAYEEIYANSWKPAEGSPPFLRRFAEEEGAAGRIRLGLAFAEGKPVAAQFWTVENGIAYIHKLAHLEEAKPLSPGTTLSAALFEHVIDRDKVSLVDFGTGDNPYKRDWMEAQRLRYRLEMFRPAWPENWLPIAKAIYRQLAGRAQHG